MLEYMQDAAEAAQFTDAMGGERPGEDVAPKPSVLISRLPDPILEHIFGYLAQGRRRHQFSMCVENGVTAGSGCGWTAASHKKTLAGCTRWTRSPLARSLA